MLPAPQFEACGCLSRLLSWLSSAAAGRARRARDGARRGGPQRHRQRFEPHRFDRRRRHRDSLCTRPERPRGRGRCDQPLSRRGAEAEAERRLLPRALGRRRARSQSLAGAGDRRRGTEGNAGNSRSRERAVRARARPLQRRRHRREDPPDCRRDGRARTRRMSRRARQCRRAGARASARGDQGSGEGAVRHLVAQWQADRCGPQHRRRRHHPHGRAP